MSKFAIETARSLLASSIEELASIDAALKIREDDVGTEFRSIDDVQRLQDRRLSVETRKYEMERWLAENNV